jgi:hypothetical protein
MQRQTLRFVEPVLLWGGVMGLTRMIASFFQGGTDWFNSKIGIIAVGAVSAAYLVWYLRHSASAHDRRVLATPRRFARERAVALGAALAKFPPQRLILVSFEGNEDGNFVVDMEIGLGTAQWHALRASHEEARAITGMRVEVSASATQEQKDAARALVEWFRAEKFIIDGPMENPERFSMTMLGRKLDDVVLKLIIGTR